MTFTLQYSIANCLIMASGNQKSLPPTGNFDFSFTSPRTFIPQRSATSQIHVPQRQSILRTIHPTSPQTTVLQDFTTPRAGVPYQSPTPQSPAPPHISGICAPLFQPIAPVPRFASDSSDSSAETPAKAESPQAQFSGDEYSAAREWKFPQAMAPPKSGNELAQYQDVLRPPRDTRTSGSSNLEESRMAPLIWWDVKEYFSRSITNGPQLKPITKTPFSQYAVLGTPEENDSVCADNGTRKPVLLNTNAPWSAFVCGSQGSGKSHALSCMLENCLLTKPDKIKKIGQNVKPLAGLVFHYDSSQSSDVCEAAYLATDVPTTVLVPPSNFGKLADRYNRLNSKYGANIKVKRLHLLPKYLDTARMKSLMAVGDTSRTPLYMQTVTKILRDMATASQGRGDFDYQMFRRMIEQEQFDVRQMGPLQMRLDLLESFMRRNKNGEILANLENDNLRGAPGTLTIIDLTDPVVDSDSAGALFNICLSVFLSQTTAGKIVALDEAHNYMAHTSASAKEFTENLVSSIRQQRHQGVRVVVSTQEPSINPRLLDLCNITMVHRCSSPDWFKTLKQHLGGIFLQQKASSLTLSDSDSEADAGVELTVDDHTLFRKIMRLGLGESLVFCPSALIGVDDKGEVVKMNENHVKFRTRQRITADGGRSRLAGEMS